MSRSDQIASKRSSKIDVVENFRKIMKFCLKIGSGAPGRSRDFISMMDGFRSAEGSIFVENTSRAPEMRFTNPLGGG